MANLLSSNKFQFAGYPATDSSIATSTTFTDTFNSTGLISISLTDANLYSYDGAIQSDTLGFQSGHYRSDPSNTTTLKIQADAGVNAEDWVFAGRYFLTPT